jgi:hypothetical protein
MPILTVSARGRVTLRKDIVQHLGVRPGGKIKVDFLPESRASLRAVRPSGSIDGFIGLLAGKTKVVATTEDIEEASARCWAGET